MKNAIPEEDPNPPGFSSKLVSEAIQIWKVRALFPEMATNFEEILISFSKYSQFATQIKEEAKKRYAKILKRQKINQ
jgi:hypothetical protein